MGGGSSKSSSSNATYDNDIMVGESGVLLQEGAAYTSLEGDGKIIETGGLDESINANSIESVKKNSENISVENGGTGNTTNITQFGEEAAQTMRRMIDTVGSVTSKNLQLYTDKNLLSDKNASAMATPGESFSAAINSTTGRIVLLAAGGALIWKITKGRKK